MTVCGIEHADGVCVMGECPYIKKCCPAVWDKSKPQEMTNEEWFTSLSTEEKARFFDRICYSAWGDINSRFRDMADYTDWVEWLKQPHTTIKECDSMARECERCEELPKCETGKNESVCCCAEYKPKQSITNGYYLRICSVDSLAEFLWSYTHDVIGDYERIRNPILREMPLKNILGDNCTKKEAWVAWLKQPHTNE